MEIRMKNTMGLKRTAHQYYEPTDASELHSLYNEIKGTPLNISIHSTGNNWGYGCNCPVEDNSLVISLKNLNKVLEFDSYHGIITIEPGVTYGQLAHFLKNQGGQWIAPVHGGGPNCSVIGNALERGYGLTPKTDHFAAVNSLEAILVDGSIYKGALAELGQQRLDQLFKYGIGPYFDGLFSQSGVGIVTKMTIRLAAKPSYLEMFSFNVFNEDDFEEVVCITKKLKQSLGDSITGINLINKERYLSMAIDYPIDKLKNGLPLDLDDLAFFSKKNLASPWLVIGAIQGEKKIVKQARKIIKHDFAKIKHRAFFYNSSNRNVFIKLANWFPKIFGIELKQMISKLEEAYKILNGQPSTVALKLAYWKNENSSLKDQKQINPTKDNCGIIWYAPLVEMSPTVVRKYVDFIQQASTKFNINSLITLTTIDDLCFDSTIPILFNQNSVADTEKAWKYYNYLLTEGAKQGFFPYRLNIETQKQFNISNQTLLPDSIVKNRYA